MLVNGAGAFTSVVGAVQLERLSFAALVEQFGSLPATNQAALVMARLSAFIIPIGTLVAGDGLALLVLERRHGINLRETQWREVAFVATYRALFVRYLQSELPDRAARLKAMAEVKGYLSAGSPPAVRALSAGNVRGAQSGQTDGVQQSNMKGQVIAYLAAHPEATQLSINNLTSVLTARGVRVGRTTVAEALREVRKVE